MSPCSRICQSIFFYGSMVHFESRFPPNSKEPKMIKRWIAALLVLSLAPAGCDDAEKEKKRKKIMKENLKPQAPSWRS